MKKAYILIISAILTCLFSINAAADGLPSAWADEEIAEAVLLDFVPEELQSDYQSKITRAEFAKLALYFASMQQNVDFDDFFNLYLELRTDENGEPLSHKIDAFTDTDDFYVCMAYSLHMVSGKGGGIFDPDGFITRQEAATLLLNTFMTYGDDITLQDKAYEPLSAFTDRDKVADWASNGVMSMCEWDVMRGVADDIFDPLGYYTREQCIATFMRLYKNAPQSRLHGNINNLLSYEDGIAGIKTMIFYHLYQELEGENCTVLYGGQTGIPHGSNTMLWIVYKTGGRRNIVLRLPQVGTFTNNFAIENLTMSEDGSTLSFTREFYFDKEPEDYAVDLSTAKLIGVD